MHRTRATLQLSAQARNTGPAGQRCGFADGPRLPGYLADLSPPVLQLQACPRALKATLHLAQITLRGSLCPQTRPRFGGQIHPRRQCRKADFIDLNQTPLDLLLAVVIAALLGVAVVSGIIVLNPSHYPTGVITVAATTLLIDILSLSVSIFKLEENNKESGSSAVTESGSRPRVVSSAARALVPSVKARQLPKADPDEEGDWKEF